LEIFCRQFEAAQRRKPFDALAEGLVSEERGGGGTAMELFLAGLKEWPVSTCELLT
jgi:hypothetical protein